MEFRKKKLLVTILLIVPTMIMFWLIFHESFRKYYHVPPKKHKILCWIPAIDRNLYNKTITVNATWVKRCDGSVIFTEYTHKDFPTVGLYVKEQGSYSLTRKIFSALTYLADQYMSQFDWFLKADDDTYIIMENLYQFLEGKDPQKPLFYGQRFESREGHIFLSGGAGYVLSRQALQIFKEKRCNISTTGVEDVDIGACFRQIGVEAVSAVDEFGRCLFHASTVVENAGDVNANWYYRLQRFWTKGISGLSDRSISFHFLKPLQMYKMEYLIYSLKVSDQSRVN